MTRIQYYLLGGLALTALAGGLALNDGDTGMGVAQARSQCGFGDSCP